MNSKDNPDSTRGSNVGDEPVQWLVAPSSNQDSYDNSVDSRGIQSQSRSVKVRGRPCHGIQKRSPFNLGGALTFGKFSKKYGKLGKLVKVLPLCWLPTPVWPLCPLSKKVIKGYPKLFVKPWPIGPLWG